MGPLCRTKSTKKRNKFLKRQTVTRITCKTPAPLTRQVLLTSNTSSTALKILFWSVFQLFVFLVQGLNFMLMRMAEGYVDGFELVSDLDTHVRVRSLTTCTNAPAEYCVHGTDLFRYHADHHKKFSDCALRRVDRLFDPHVRVGCLASSSRLAGGANNALC